METEQEYLQREQEGLKRRYEDMGKRMQVIFFTIIINIALTVVMTIYALIAGVVAGVMKSTNLTGVYIGLGVFAVLMIVATIIFGINLLKMGYYDDALKTAAILYFINQGISIVQSFLSDAGFLTAILKIAAAIISLFYFTNFCSGMENLSYVADSNVSYNWEKIRKFYVTLVIVMVCCVIGCIIPVIGILAALVLIVAAIAMIVIYIWQIVLIYQTMRAMQNYRPRD